MILFSDAQVAEKARILRDHGMSKNKRYWHDVVGYNYRLTNMQAAIGVAQMEKFQEILSKKLRIAAFYESALKGIPGIVNLPAKVKKPCTLIGYLGLFWMKKLILKMLLANCSLEESRPDRFSIH